VASLKLGAAAGCGPAITPDNVIYLGAVTDSAGRIVTSKMYRGATEMSFSSEFAPSLEHFPHDDFPVPQPPVRCTP
jgi:hypothetical protein